MSKTAIKIKDLDLTFSNGSISQVLKDINIEIKEHEFVSIVGPSGCGKSTLFKLIAELSFDKDSEITGDIKILGKTPLQAREDNEIGLVFQKPTLLEWRSVSKNIQLPLEIMGYSKDYTQKRTTELLRLIDLQEYGKYRPTQLSGGMKQKVSIARALAYDPKILLMDEPFAALDEINRKKMNDELIKIWKKTKKTILFVTHSIEEAIYLSQRVLVMSSKPSTVYKEVNIDLEYPRNEDDSEYFKYVKDIRKVLNEAING